MGLSQAHVSVPHYLLVYTSAAALPTFQLLRLLLGLPLWCNQVRTPVLYFSAVRKCVLLG